MSARRPKAARRTQSSAVDLRSLAEFVEQFAGKRVVLLGDFVADEFQYGEITRVSREAPVLILRHRETRLVPGGGANAANNLRNLGAKVFPVSAVGDDVPGRELLALFREKHVDTSSIIPVRGWTTPTKTRFLAGWAHTVAQQVLRVDHEPNSSLPPAIQKRLSKQLQARLRNADAFAISDYGFGVATPELVKTALPPRGRPIPVTLDSRYRLHDYAGVGITAATPNEAELELLHHRTIGSDLRELERCGTRSVRRMRLQSLVVTRGRHGMTLFGGLASAIHIPVHGSDQAVDVTGAGDTVLATFTLSLACGASPLEAAHLANIAGGLVVMKRGTATVTREELYAAICDDIAGESH
jgi:D-glycero-beta-D-manno-heptose-7-phosphate kinase